MHAYYLKNIQKHNWIELNKKQRVLSWYTLFFRIVVQRMVSIARFVIFLFCYGICVMSLSNIILYLNYRTLGYSWHAVMLYILNSVEMYLALGTLGIMFIVVYGLNPSRSPSS